MARKKKKLLIIEDEPSVAKQMKWGLGKDYEIAIAGDIVQAERLLSTGSYPVATLDLGLPPFPDNPSQGLGLLERIPAISPATRVIVITGNDQEEIAIKAVSLGAADFCSKPIDLKVLKIILERTFRLRELEEANRRLKSAAENSDTLCGMIGMSDAMKRVFQAIRLAANTDYPVLITGSTGTGKEVAARAIHSLSKRAKKPFSVINCGAIPETLIESELFGHEKGAFTGASSRRIGQLEQAEGGSVFLDEIGELPLSMQVKLLRFLQESTIQRLGGRGSIKIDARVIAATNRDLETAVKRGDFREDLFYRLNVINITLPDLKERGEDVVLLAHRFLSEEASKLNRKRMTFSPDALAALINHKWPGNVRELQNCIRRAIAASHSQVIKAIDLGLEESAAKGDREDAQEIVPLKKARAAAERESITRALAVTGGNISQAARLLKVSRPTLHDLLKKHGITKEG